MLDLEQFVDPYRGNVLTVQERAQFTAVDQPIQPDHLREFFGLPQKQVERFPGDFCRAFGISALLTCHVMHVAAITHHVQGQDGRKSYLKGFAHCSTLPDNHFGDDVEVGDYWPYYLMMRGFIGVGTASPNVRACWCRLLPKLRATPYMTRPRFLQLVGEALAERAQHHRDEVPSPTLLPAPEQLCSLPLPHTTSCAELEQIMIRILQVSSVASDSRAAFLQQLSNVRHHLQLLRAIQNQLQQFDYSIRVGRTLPGGEARVPAATRQLYQRSLDALILRHLKTLPPYHQRADLFPDDAGRHDQLTEQLTALLRDEKEPE